jgi:serine kinase of HPr protein (carbohydrate metabolism regulator)
METTHGTLVKLLPGAALLRGPSGSGKSDLAFRLIDRGAVLVADDRVAVWADGDRLIGAPPKALAGLIELRGIGIVEFPYMKEAAIDLVVDLVDSGEIERLPEDRSCEILGLELPLTAVAPFETSAPLKVEMMAKAIARKQL